MAVVGQGYVGLTLSCAAAEAGFSVVGIDIDHSRIDDLERGELCVAGASRDSFDAALTSGRLSFTTEPEPIGDSDVIVVCVPTPIRDHSPDLSHVETASKEVARHLVPGGLVVLESTTYPGTTEVLVRPLLESSGLVAGRDFLLAYSPERIDPGNESFGLRNTPRLVGGTTTEATGIAAEFYGQLTDQVVTTSEARVAELAKLLENTFRHVNVALVNEMAMLCHEMGIDVWEVIEAAATKPFGFMPFYPGPGIGGHCIPLDPTYLAWQVRRDAGHQFRVLEQAEDINAQMPTYVASRIGEALNEAGRALNGAGILMLGVSYKPDVGDARESPAVKVMNVLHRRHARVSFHDPFVDTISLNGGTLVRTELTEEAVATADLVAVVTAHGAYDLEWIAQHASLVFDARNAFGNGAPSHVVRL